MFFSVESDVDVVGEAYDGSEFSVSSEGCVFYSSAFFGWDFVVVADPLCGHFHGPFVDEFCVWVDFE